MPPARTSSRSSPPPLRSCSAASCSSSGSISQPPFHRSVLYFPSHLIILISRDVGCVEATKELVEFNRDKQISGVSISLPDGSHDLTHLIGSITGPVSSPYERGTFTIDIRLPTESEEIFGMSLEYRLLRSSILDRASESESEGPGDDDTWDAEILDELATSRGELKSPNYWFPS